MTFLELGGQYIAEVMQSYTHAATTCQSPNFPTKSSSKTTTSFGNPMLLKEEYTLRQSVIFDSGLGPCQGTQGKVRGPQAHTTCLNVTRIFTFQSPRFGTVWQLTVIDYDGHVKLSCIISPDLLFANGYIWVFYLWLHSRKILQRSSYINC